MIFNYFFTYLLFFKSELTMAQDITKDKVTLNEVKIEVEADLHIQPSAPPEYYFTTYSYQQDPPPPPSYVEIFPLPNKIKKSPPKVNKPKHKFKCTPQIKFPILCFITFLYLIFYIIAYVKVNNLNAEPCGTKSKLAENDETKYDNPIIEIIKITCIINIIYCFLNISTLMCFCCNDDFDCIGQVFCFYNCLYWIITIIIFMSLIKNIFFISLGGGENSCYEKTRALWDWGLTTFILQILFLLTDGYRFINFIKLRD